MSNRELNDEGFVSLWPTRLLQRVIPGSTAANSELLQLILQHEKQHSDISGTAASKDNSVATESATGDLTTDYLSQSLLEIDAPVIGWLTTCVNKTVSDYLKQEGLRYNVDWGLQAWANINRFGEYHNLHNHPHSYLSGTYYVSVPAKVTHEQIGRVDQNPGAISFFDPRPQANMMSIKGDAQIDPEFRVEPDEGMMLLWPSFLHHFVHPNLSQQKRVSISFNVVLKWRDEYVPH